MNLFIAVLKTTFSKYGNSPLHRQVGKKKKRRSSLTMAFDFVKQIVSRVTENEKPGGLDQHLSMAAKRKASVKFGSLKNDEFIDEGKDNRDLNAGKSDLRLQDSMVASRSFGVASQMSRASSGQSGYFGSDGPKLDADVTVEVKADTAYAGYIFTTNLCPSLICTSPMYYISCLPDTHFLFPFRSSTSIFQTFRRVGVHSSSCSSTCASLLRTLRLIIASWPARSQAPSSSLSNMTACHRLSR